MASERKTQKQIAIERNVTVRTVQRWVKLIDIQDDAAIDSYLAERARPGKTESDATQKPTVTKISKTPITDIERRKFNVRTTSALIEAMNEFCADAASDLDVARRSGKSTREIAIVAKTFNESVARLSSVLLEQDKLKSSGEQTYHLQDILTVFTAWAKALKFTWSSPFVHYLTNEMVQRGFLDPAHRAEAAGLMTNTVKCGLFPHLSDTAAQFVKELANAKSVVTLDERHEMLSVLTSYWQGQVNQ
jgi:hypothetical protein